MKLLLTSAGVKNPSINDALLGLLGKPVSECSALCVPTATYPITNGSLMSWRFVTGQSSTPMTELGWASMGILELSALSIVDPARWVPLLRETDALLVNGGDVLFLCHWMRASGLAELLPKLSDLTYVGLSAGSMVMAPHVGPDFVHWNPEGGGDEGLGLVDFAIFPHLDHVDLPENTMADAEDWATTISIPGYAIDDETAIMVNDGTVQVISEGHWRLFPN